MHSYELLVEQHIQAGRYEQAKKLLDEMQAEFDNPDELLSKVIGVQKKRGKVLHLMACVVWFQLMQD